MHTWISSMTATSTGSVTLAISTVHDTCAAPSTRERSWPVTRSHGTPSALSRSAFSTASSRSGPQYTPDGAFFSACARARRRGVYARAERRRMRTGERLQGQ